MYKVGRVTGRIIGEIIVDESIICDENCCYGCKYENTWICKRFFTRTDILPYILGRKLVAVEFIRHDDLIKNSWYWMDRLTRMYGWDTIPLASFHCDICGNPSVYCGEKYCLWRVRETIKKPTPRTGFKKFWWCSKYIFINLPVSWEKNNIMVYLVRNIEPYSWLGEIGDKVKKEDVEFFSLCHKQVVSESF